MKRMLVLLLAVLLLSGMTGCRSAEYLHIQEHVDPFSYKETTAEETEEQRLSASDYYSLRSVLLSVMTEGTEHSEIFLDAYSGNTENDLKRVAAYMTNYDPVGAFAIDYINYELKEDRSGASAVFDIVYRRSAGEIAAIRSVRGNDQADSAIYAALEEFAPSVTLQISGYTEEDFEQTVRAYCLAHPDKTVLCEEVSVAVYPQTGNVRVAEFHFSYDMTKDALRSTVSDTATVLTSAYNYMRYGKSAEDCATLALSYLVGRFQYQQDEAATVYTLLCQGISNSMSFSSAFAYLCNNADIPCRIVEGTKQDAPYDWTMIEIDGVWYHFDVSQTVLAESRVLQLKTDYEMTGYSWDREALPVCDGTPAETEATAENG